MIVACTLMNKLAPATRNFYDQVSKACCWQQHIMCAMSQHIHILSSLQAYDLQQILLILKLTYGQLMMQQRGLSSISIIPARKCQSLGGSCPWAHVPLAAATITTPTQSSELVMG